MKKHIFAISSMISLLMVSCQDELTFDDSKLSGSEGITFHISTPVKESDRISRGEAAEEKVASLHYLLADANGKVLTHCFGHLSDGLDRLDLEGLEAGKYSIVFLGSSMESELASIEYPATLDETWLQNTTRSLPIEGSYFFKKFDFTVGQELTQTNYEVMLDRALSRIKVEFPGIPSAVESMISSVTVSLDEGCHVYSAINADCSYSGEATIRNCEVCDSGFNLMLNTLPSRGPLSGTVIVKAATLSGDSLSTMYRFSDLTAEAGKVNRITISMRHPDLKTGFLRIRPTDYFDYDAALMLMEDEPLSVLHDCAQRHFMMTNPLVVKTDRNQLRLQLYSAAPSENVDIFANFPSLGIDSVRLVHFDRVEALLDMMVPMTFTKREAQYLDIHGKRVTIPKMDIPSNIEWFVKTDDPYLTRMSKLSLKKWDVSFHDWEAIWPSKAITPDRKCMRHAFVQMINLALTLDSEEFEEELAAHEGQYIECGTICANGEIIDRIHNHCECCYGMGASNPSSGANGWGGGMHAGYASLIINQEYFVRMYPTVNPETPCNRERECFYHEFAHCLGFTHDGNMTYGGVWTNTVGTAYLKAHAAGKIFFYSPDFVDSLPYRRSEAPDWATARLVGACL
ncbi:MAG: hypothetical protein K2N25_04535 [Muribaculaceae bacterium]|nr:hypothetical protein [Muribaculaceae bacterium]